MSTLEKRKDLTLRIEDLEPLGIVPMKVSNGELVAAELEKIVAKVGGRPPLAIEPFAKLEAALYEVPVPKDGSISTNPIAKAIGEELSSHYLVPPRVWSASSFAKGSIVKDQGSDLRCGGRNPCEKYPQIIDMRDVPHKIACLYKKTLENDSDWNRFISECSNFKKRMQLTKRTPFTAKPTIESPVS